MFINSEKIYSFVYKTAFLLVFGFYLFSISTKAQIPNPPQPTNPVQPPATTTSPRTNSGTVAPNNNNVPQTPGQNVGDSKTVPASDLPTEPPPVAPNFVAPVRPLPSAERVGVDALNQLSLTLDDAIRMALQNNNDIDSSRITV